MKKRHLQLYPLIILPLIAVILFLLWQGKKLEANTLVSSVTNAGSQNHFIESTKHPLSIMLLQIVVILSVARLVGYIFQRIGQQSVIGEITAGIILGPSLLGLVIARCF
jgi:hypothetical protein